MSILNAIILGIIEGVTEFLPVSSTGHLTVAEKIMGYTIDSPSVTAFTAVIQIGAILAAIIYFRKDIIRITHAWIRGVLDKSYRNSHDYTLGWAVIVGTIPIGVVGILFSSHIESILRNLWIVAVMLVLWSGVIWYADNFTKHDKHEKDLGKVDALKVGIVQCLALVPGVSRSGATISAGLLLGFDRVVATRLSFFLGIPALIAAGIFEAVTQAKYISSGVGWTATSIATAVSFLVGYVSISWLLKYISNNSFTIFVWYRVIAGITLLAMLYFGLLN